MKVSSMKPCPGRMLAYLAMTRIRVIWTPSVQASGPENMKGERGRVKVVPPVCWQKSMVKLQEGWRPHQSTCRELASASTKNSSRKGTGPWVRFYIRMYAPGLPACKSSLWSQNDSFETFNY